MITVSSAQNPCAFEIVHKRTICYLSIDANSRQATEDTALNLEAIRNLRFEAVTHAYAARDSILYLRPGASRIMGEESRSRH